MRLLLFLLCCLLSGLACRPATEAIASGSLRIATAANMQYAVAALGEAFTAATGIPVEPIIGSSGKLQAQISQGAPFHVFLSADLDYPTALYQQGHTVAPPQIYAYGSLVVWSLQALPVPFEWAFLARSEIKNIAIANPRNAPYGREAIRSLEALGLLPAVQDKLVYGESVAQANQYILTGACQLGITAQASLFAPGYADKGYYRPLPPDSYQPIAQGVVITKFGGRQAPATGRQFVQFLLAASGRRILADYGYQLPEVEE